MGRRKRETRQREVEMVAKKREDELVARIARRLSHNAGEKVGVV